MQASTTVKTDRQTSASTQFFKSSAIRMDGISGKIVRMMWMLLLRYTLESDC